jgi:hypothetical protein
MPDELTEKKEVLKLARELESLGVNVRGFLEQAVDGEKRAHFRARLFDLESAGVIRPNDYERRRLRHFADELRERAESSFVLFAPSLLWELARLRRELWNGDETKARERDVREALQLVADALADRRTGTHGRPTPGGVLRRRREDAHLVTLLAKLAEAAVYELERNNARREETADYYVTKLRRFKFWSAVDQSFHFDPEAPDARASRLAYTKHRLEHDLFFPTRDHPKRPFFGAVVAAMAAALLGGEVDPAIFGGSGEADKRVTARSLAIRALRQLHHENLEIPKR